jgi:hypothetical protein
MSLTGIIRRRDRRPLGSVEDVKRGLAGPFPGVEFTYVAEEPAASAMLARQLTLFQRVLLSILSRKTRYPHIIGDFQRPGGAALQFYFEVAEPVRWIRATSYGMTAGLDENFDRLAAETGWFVKYPRF